MGIFIVSYSVLCVINLDFLLPMTNLRSIYLTKYFLDMEWVLQSPQVHTVFGSLGYPHGDGYRISEKCNGKIDN